MLSLKGMGVNGFITDYPDQAKKVQNDPKHSTPLKCGLSHLSKKRPRADSNSMQGILLYHYKTFFHEKV